MLQNVLSYLKIITFSVVCLGVNLFEMHFSTFFSLSFKFQINILWAWPNPFEGCAIRGQSLGLYKINLFFMKEKPPVFSVSKEK